MRDVRKDGEDYYYPLNESETLQCCQLRLGYSYGGFELIQDHVHLIEAARSGDLQATARLLTVCQPDLKRFARRKCASSEDAEDAVQIALWQLYRKIGALRTAAMLGTWLFRIVERECYRLFRQQPKDESLDGEAARNLVAAQVPANLQMDICQAIAVLAPAYRDVLILRDVEELTASETAEQLGISVDAVKSRLHRARADMRQRLISVGYWSKDAP